MEYIPGGELFTHLRKRKKFTEAVAAYYAAEVLLALEYLHNDLKIIYRDLKPENVLLTRDGHIKLTDFGLSKKKEICSSYCGTPEYLAPEIIKGDNYNQTIDFWCLGCLIHEMIAGKPPFRHKDKKSLYSLIKNEKITFEGKNFSEGAQNLILKLMQKNPKVRLGCNGIEEIKKHRFFADINWDDLY